VLIKPHLFIFSSIVMPESKKRTLDSFFSPAQKKKKVEDSNTTACGETPNVDLVSGYCVPYIYRAYLSSYLIQ